MNADAHFKRHLANLRKGAEENEMSMIELLAAALDIRTVNALLAPPSGTEMTKEYRTVFYGWLANRMRDYANDCEKGMSGIRKGGLRRGRQLADEKARNDQLILCAMYEEIAKRERDKSSKRITYANIAIKVAASGKWKGYGPTDDHVRKILKSHRDELKAVRS